MKAHFTRWSLAGSLAACILLVAAFAYAEIPGVAPVMFRPDEGAQTAAPADLSGVAHHWVERAVGIAPYTEMSPVEAAALSAARNAVVAPSAAVFRNADHGYDSAQAEIDQAARLKGANAQIVGHELIVWNGERAVKVFVNQDGVMTVVGDGSPWLLATPSTKLVDQGDKDAAEIARSAVAVGEALEGRSAAPTKAVVTAHAVGLADEMGGHVVMRVTPDGRVSHTTW